MKAELADGLIVELQKDCDCVTHDGPHWIYMDKLWRMMNQELLNIGTDLACNGFAKEDLARLQIKEREMQRQGIKRLIESEAL